MEARTLAAALLLSAVVATPPATAEGLGPLDPFVPVLQSAQAAAESLAGTGAGIAETGLGMAQDFAGPAASIVGSVAESAAILYTATSKLSSEFVAIGEGAATMDLDDGAFHGTCSALHAAVEYHEPFSSETPLYFDFHAGQGSSALGCASGWRGAFQPDEVHGDLEHGITASSESIDAIIDLWLGPVRADGSRVLWVRQVTFPSGIGDVLEFWGSVVEVA